jgi:hypothetical protein
VSEDVAARLSAVHERMQAAIARRGPGPAVTLIGVGKRQPPAAIAAAVRAGLSDVGENYAQELRDKLRELAGLPIRWHFIGGLQSNKLKYLVGHALIHTVDRAELLEPLSRRAVTAGTVQDVLIEINLGEPQKAGVAPERAAELLDAFAGAPAVRCVGLMTIPPAEGPARPHFAALRALRDRLAATARPRVELRELSMGMSDDFESAIEEGATMIRVGTAIFGARPW